MGSERIDETVKTKPSTAKENIGTIHVKGARVEIQETETYLAWILSAEIVDMAHDASFRTREDAEDLVIDIVVTDARTAAIAGIIAVTTAAETEAVLMIASNLFYNSSDCF